jgi:glycerophosphoryl diester phosphodiesterase
VLRLGNTDEGIPTLEQVLALVDGRAPILFEIKNYGLACNLEKAFYSVMRHYHGKYAVQSFSPYSLRWFRRHAPHVPRGQLACDYKHACVEGSVFFRLLVNLILYPIKRLETNFMSRPHFISCEFHRLQAELLKHLRRKGASVLAWTIRNNEQFASAQPFIDSVIFERFLPRA